MQALPPSPKMGRPRRDKRRNLAGGLSRSALHFFLDNRYRVSYHPNCVNARPSGSQSAAFSFVGAKLARGRDGPTYRALPLPASKAFKMRSSRAPKSCTILVQITPLESALTETDPVSSAEC